MPQVPDDLATARRIAQEAGLDTSRIPVSDFSIAGDTIHYRYYLRDPFGHALPVKSDWMTAKVGGTK